MERLNPNVFSALRMCELCLENTNNTLELSASGDEKRRVLEKYFKYGFMVSVKRDGHGMVVSLADCSCLFHCSSQSTTSIAYAQNVGTKLKISMNFAIKSSMYIKCKRSAVCMTQLSRIARTMGTRT